MARWERLLGPGELPSMEHPCKLIDDANPHTKRGTDKKAASVQPLYVHLFFAAFGIAMIWYVIRALQTGKLPLRFVDPVFRNERPVFYWWGVITAALIGPGTLALAIFGTVKISN